MPVSGLGLDVYTSAGDHVIVDITGYFTGPSATRSTDGLYVPADPQRLVDTRTAYGSSGGPRLWDGGSREFSVSLITGPASAVAANVTVTNTEDVGFVTARPARSAVPVSTSTVNYHSATQTVANSTVVGLSERGLMVEASSSTHVVIDITGWFTGTPTHTDGPAPFNPQPAPRRVTIIADSAMAGIRWNGALEGLRGFEAITRLESCRRLVRGSCRGRGGSVPRNVVSEIDALPPAGPEEILVVATGYNDWSDRFESDLEIVLDAARHHGFRHVAWVTYRSGVDYVLPGTTLHSNYAAMNQILATKAASGEFPYLRVWDLDRYTAGLVDWFASDGVHQRTLGSWGVADWLSRHVLAFDDKPCVLPWRPGGLISDPCPDPDGQPATLGHPDIVGLYAL